MTFRPALHSARLSEPFFLVLWGLVLATCLFGRSPTRPAAWAQESTAEENVADEANAADQDVAGDEGETADAAPADAEGTADQGADEKAEEKAEPAPKVLVTFPLRGGLPETTSEAGLFAAMETNLREIVGRLDQAAADDDVHAILLKIRQPSVGRGRLEELRGAIQRVRETGKKVYADLDSATTSDYLIACACDEIYMPPAGTLMLPGLRAEFTFYKQLFDKFDIDVDMMQVGDYKGAAEAYTRDHMSEPFREQYTAILDDLYQQMVRTVAQDRQLKRKRVRKLIDQGLFTATAAKAAGLIDHVAYPDEWQQRLARDTDSSWQVVENYAKKEVDTDFSGMAGFFKLIDMFSGNSGKGSRTRASGQKVAVVYALGPITTGSGGASLLGGQVMGSDAIIKALRRAEDDESVVAVVLRVDSPGGSALASDLIWRQVQGMDKPIVASMGDVAASGGYYISMGCDKIVAQPGTLTGSIGVVGGKIAYGRLMERFGVTTDVLSRGKNSGIFSGQTRFTDSERTAWKTMMDDIYRQFTEKAAAGRGMDVKDLQALAGGRVWTGRQAKRNGLVDELGSLRDAIGLAASLGGIEAGSKPELLILPESKSFFDQLLGGDVTTRWDQLPRDIQAVLADLEVLGALFQEPAVLVLPYRVQIR